MLNLRAPYRIRWPRVAESRGPGDNVPDGLGFIRGFVAPFRGAAFVARHRLWRYVVVPLLLNVALVAASIAVALDIVRDRLGPAAAGSPLMLAGLWVVAILLGMAWFIVLQPLVGAPFVDALSDRTERLVRGQSANQGWLSSLGQTLASGLLKAACYGLCLLAAVALSTVTGAGGALVMGLYALFLAFDGFDYPLARRGTSFLGKWRYLALHPGQTLGYCVGAGLLYLVPAAVVVAPAFAAVGATLAYLDSTPEAHAALA